MSKAELAIVEPRQRSVLAETAARYGMDAAPFEQTLRATVVPEKCSKEQFAAFIMVANQYGLNPITKEIYAFPTRSGGIQPIVGIDGWCNLINSNPQLDGIEFDDHLDGESKLTSVTCRIWRKDREKPTTVTEYMTECVRGTDPWKQYPRRMLRHKALIQCARYAFGYAGIVDPDEAERIGVIATPRREGPADQMAPSPPNPDAPPETPQKPLDGEILPPEKAVQPPNPDRMEEDTKAEPLDEPQFLKDLDGALGGCEDMVSFGEKQAQVMKPAKGQVGKETWGKAEAIALKHYHRLTGTTMDAG